MTTPKIIHIENVQSELYERRWRPMALKCTTPFLIEKYNSYTLQILNGYISIDNAKWSLEDHIKAHNTGDTNVEKPNPNPYIGKTVVELIKLRHPIQDALYRYPFPKGDRAIELVHTLNQINEAERIATKEKNFGV